MSPENLISVEFYLFVMKVIVILVIILYVVCFIMILRRLPVRFQAVQNDVVGKALHPTCLGGNVAVLSR